MSDRYLSGMRESKPEVCWRIIDNGEQVCILDRGHDDGVHERDEQAAARGHFARRFRRLYRYFRGSPKMIGAAYRHNPRSRRQAIWLAWGYARKGGDAA